METKRRLTVAVVGAGMAGAACARALVEAGHAVAVFDKSRGPGGRLATRRLAWTDPHGQPCTARLDHGAVAISARTPNFQAFVQQALGAGWLAPWSPIQSGMGWPACRGEALVLPVPDMPSLCRHLIEALPCTWSMAVDSLHKRPQGWQLAAGGVPHDALFDAVVLAVPPAQAAPLLAGHRPDWARHAAVALMAPCWTLMGVADAPVGPAAPSARSADFSPWDIATPTTGPLACVMRGDARPGRAQVPGQAHWVAHARPGWSRRHLEAPAAWVQQQLQTALDDCLGAPVVWQHSVVHRWRYALPRATLSAPGDACWWDAQQGLGVCGDFLGGAGVEGAWLSAQSLATALARAPQPKHTAPTRAAHPVPPITPDVAAGAPQ